MQVTVENAENAVVLQWTDHATLLGEKHSQHPPVHASAAAWRSLTCAAGLLTLPLLACTYTRCLPQMSRC